MEVGKSVRRVDAFDKATGRAKYCDDLCDRSALVARVLHSTIANGVVKSIDTSAAEQIEKPLPMAAVVLPAESSVSVISRMDSGWPDISAMPPALSAIGP